MTRPGQGRRPRPGWFGALAAVLAVLAVGLLIGAPAGHAVSGVPTAVPAGDPGGNPFQKGPDPTEAGIESGQGPFQIATVSVPPGAGFGGGIIFYPTDTSQGSYAGIAISPGIMGTDATIGWYGPLLAAQGFVVFTISTLSVYDPPSTRGDELRSALDYLTGSSPVRAEVDPNRLGVMGHSLGGGGAVEAEANDPTLKAAIPLSEWDITADLSNVRTPTMFIGAQFDVTAPDLIYSLQAYQQLPEMLDKQYLELAGGNHGTALTPTPTIAKYAISWMKRFLDNDTRYDQFLCPIVEPADDPTLSAHQGTCPN
ncbi:MAG TPA: alpha/beta hydrolase [Pseudonocardiaceae bacterium]|nr:alpha/beta hydrolase [Pseudonocardiaceae bacterium]